MRVSVLVPVRDRIGHLANLVDGLNRAEEAPAFELPVGWMGGEDPHPALARAEGFEAAAVGVPGKELPLSGARNALADAAAAAGSLLVFLDVDCVPSGPLLRSYASALGDGQMLAIGETRYLPDEFLATGAEEESLRVAARPHPRRNDLFPPCGEVRIDRCHDLFWSLNFAIRRDLFRERIGGFDEAYHGYGIEDTDFAMRAARAGVPVAWVGGALAFHQHHAPTRLRPEGVPALVENVRRYRERWGGWPAKGWLAELAAEGMITWDEGSGLLEARPSAMR